MTPLDAGFWLTIAVLVLLVSWRYSKVLQRQIAVQQTVADAELTKAQAALANAERLREIGKLGGRPRETRRRKDDDEDEDDEDDEPSPVERMAVQFAAGMGVDLYKAADGDINEVAKVRDIAKTIEAQRAGAVAGGAGDL